MMTNEPRIWEIWQFAFTYEDKPEKSKLRPVIIAAKILMGRWLLKAHPV